MDKILQELHSLRDQTLNNSSCRGASPGVSERPSTSSREGNGDASVARQDSSSYDDGGNPAEKLRKLKLVHKRLNDNQEDETEDLDEENREPVTNIRNPAQPQSTSNWMDMNTLTNACSSSNNPVSRLNSQCEVNNRLAANLHSLNVSSTMDKHGNVVQDDDDDDDPAEEDDRMRRRRRESSGSASRQRSSIVDNAEFADVLHRLQMAKQKLQQLRELDTSSDPMEVLLMNFRDDLCNQILEEERSKFGQ